MMKVLFYGYGNPGRRDDGLGISFVERLERHVREHRIAGIHFDSNYQLNIEDAEEISHYDRVIFCDASFEAIEDFCLTEVHPSDARIEFTMHAVSPAYVVDLCRKLYGQHPATWLLHLKGYEWEFREGLSPRAEKNLEKALAYFVPLLNHLGQKSAPFLPLVLSCQS